MKYIKEGEMEEKEMMINMTGNASPCHVKGEWERMAADIVW